MPVLRPTVLPSGKEEYWNTKGEAIPGVIVSVSRTEERTIADEMGYFTLPDDVVAGDTLTFTSMGFKPTRRIVPPADGSNKTFTIRMKDGMTTLQEVEVVGRYEKSYKNTLSFIGTKTATPPRLQRRSRTYRSLSAMSPRSLSSTKEPIPSMMW